MILRDEGNMDVAKGHDSKETLSIEGAPITNEGKREGLLISSKSLDTPSTKILGSKTSLSFSSTFPQHPLQNLLFSQYIFCE
jgi:hypothetical protein